MVTDENILSSSRMDPGELNISFSGCGFLGLYHVGVVSCIREYAPHLAKGKAAGASAGALAACALVTDCCLGESTSYILDVALKARERALGPLHPSFNVVKYLRDGLNAFLPDNAHELASGRLYISLTRVSDQQNVLVSHYESKEDLIQAVICSAFVPFYCGVIPPKYRGVRYVDGGITDNVPSLNPNTITVSPFAGESDICPNDNSQNFMHVTLANTSIQFTAANFYRFSRALFPPHPEVLSNMCRQGFDDTLKYLQRNNLINCTRHFSIQSSIVSSTPLRVDSLQTPLTIADDESIIDYIEVSESESDLGFEDDDEQAEEDSVCSECQHRQHVALLDNLPPKVITALQSACDSVNRGLLAPVYNLRAFKALALMAAPWILPLDLMIVLGKRFLEWAPYMPGDMQWFVNEFRSILQEIFHVIQCHRHRYSARFTCQLAITEMDFHKEKESSGVPAAPCRHRRPRSNSLSSLCSSSSEQQKKINIGFSVDFESHCHSPMQCVNELRHQILEEDEKINIHPVVTNSPNMVTDNEIVNATGSSEESSSSTSQRSRHPSGAQDMSYDTFENCLHIANQMEALLSFYYMEEKDPNTIRVTEIYPLNDPRSPKPDFDVSDLAWDSYLELKNESSGTEDTTRFSRQPDITKESRRDYSTQQGDHLGDLATLDTQGFRKRSSSLTALNQLPY